ncbi:restriction endonuclease subunit S [Brachyspira intermedia]|uniref:restriction endonuclease subunit S n=1 Tax=Brachyspira intermedia TaxID=84377 RepID=UPI003005E358
MKNTHLPTGWQEKKIGEIFSFIKNYSNSRAELNDYDDISYIHYGDIHKHYRHRIECNKVDFPKISAEKLSKDINNISYVENGDLIVVDASEDYEGTCISAEIKNLNYKLVSGLHTFLLRDKNKIFADGYRGYIFYNHDVHIQCCKVATGISVYGISQENLKNIKIMIPPLDEQKRIAEVLSLCDDIIENLTELIDKKEQYKKGVMQRLLSGEVRFKGFTDEWKEVYIKEVGTIITGNTPSTKDKSFWGDTHVWVTPTDINNKYMNNSERKLTDIGLSKVRKLPKDTLLVTCIASIGKNTILKCDGSCNQQINAIITNSNFDVEFLYYIFENNKEYLNAKAPASATKIISKTEFEKLSFVFPSLEEQKKIAGLLSAIDEDIENLKKQLELRKQQKKGLMQRLLTGEVRI